MNLTENDALRIADTVLNDFKNSPFDGRILKHCRYYENDELARPRGSRANVWVAVIDNPLFDDTQFIVISDETGEPLYIQTKHTVNEIVKNGDGKYTTM